jgi:hypothetical protein
LLPVALPLEIAVRKSIIPPGGQDEPAGVVAWMDLDKVARVEVTSEDPDHPIEAGLLPGRGPGWRASRSGPQTIRLVFDGSRHVRRIRLRFVADAVARTQEFVLRWVNEASESREVVRQQWNFSPSGSTRESEDYRVDLEAVRSLEITIRPDLTHQRAVASIARLRLAGPSL